LEVVETGTDFDATEKRDGRQWHASPQARFERLLRETEVPSAYFLTEHISGWCTRREANRQAVSPFLCKPCARFLVDPLLRRFTCSCQRTDYSTVPTPQRLPAILRESRKYQNEVSTKLAEQVLAALNELLRGFQAANEATQGELLKDPLQKDPTHIYGGLLASLMRLVFILYAEDRGLLPLDPIFVNNYTRRWAFSTPPRGQCTLPGHYGPALRRHGCNSLRFPADLRWRCPCLDTSPRPSRQAFRPRCIPVSRKDGPMDRLWQPEDPLKPLVCLTRDLSCPLEFASSGWGSVFLTALSMWRQIGSVYEAMMGYELQVATGPSVGLRPDNVVVNLEEVLRAPRDERPKVLREISGCELTGQALEQFKLAAQIEDLLTALGKKISGLTPYIVPRGGMFLQPTDERRRSGSDYTPRSLTEPIVRNDTPTHLRKTGRPSSARTDS